jgi:hypothetical protein
MLFFDSYAYAPKGKYKALQAEVEAKEQQKEEEKKAKKEAKRHAKELSNRYGGVACSVGVIGKTQETQNAQEPQTKDESQANKNEDCSLKSDEES